MRRQLSRVIRAILVALLFVFITANVSFVYTRIRYVESDHHYRQSEIEHTQQLVTKLRLEQGSRLQSSLNLSNATRGSVEHNSVSAVDTSNLTLLKSFVLDSNTEQTVLNADKFMPVLDENGVVVIIQVHKRVQYLKLLIESLRSAKDISQVLVIFSHDLISNEINQLIQAIDFCPVMQIFYPYSMQLYPKEFPGEDPQDCPRNMNKDEAVKKKCNNANHPDMYGHYREAKFVQTKHHWFWKIHRVFDELPITRNFTGPVILLEEDHYVAPDFVHIIRHMYSGRIRLCPECNIFTLGTYDKSPSFENSDKVKAHGWLSSKHNMAMSIDREMWENVKQCSKVFCDFDDYNWDWSLQHISAKCLKNSLRVMVVSSPRVFHMGECGVHHKGKNCNPAPLHDTITKLLKDNKHRLFPSRISLDGSSVSVNRVYKPNGGWGDIRDRELCKSFISDTKQKR